MVVVRKKSGFPRKETRWCTSMARNYAIIKVSLPRLVPLCLNLVGSLVHSKR
jgi:hypothetical protein